MIRGKRSWTGWTLACVFLLSLTGYTVVGDATTQSAPVTTQGTIDLAHVVRPITRYAIGLGASTYGATILSSSDQARNERRLDAAMVRIPVSVRRGVVTSGAVGAGRVPVPQLVARYLQWGYRVLVVIDGAGGRGPVHPGDARTIITRLGFGDRVQYSTSNEPDNDGQDVGVAIRQAQMILREGRALYPGFRIWGPVWSSYDRQAIRQFAAALGSGLAGIDFHAYGMGERPVSTAQALRDTSLLGDHVSQTRSDLRAFGSDAGVSVDELNLSWRFADGTPGGEYRLLSAVDTVWLASACGHVMLAGGSCLPYADQNGPLGMLAEAGQIPRDRQASTPMPGYWGIGAWTGAGLFPHAGDAFLAAQVAVPGIEVFAVRNEANGYNIVVIDKNEQPATTPFVLALRNAGRGTYVPYATDASRPYDAPVAGPATPYGSTVSLVVHAMTVTTLVLTPAA